MSPERPETAPAGGPPRSGFVRLGLLFYGGLLGLAGLGAAWSGRSLLYASPAAEAAGISWGRDVALGLAVALAVIGGSALVTGRTRFGARMASALAELLGPLRLRDCLLLAVASGLAEEAFFRGLLQPWLGWIATSVLFGIAHWAPRRDLLPWTGFALVAGFGLGALFALTGNLVAPVLAHAGVNAVNLRRLSRRARS